MRAKCGETMQPAQQQPPVASTRVACYRDKGHEGTCFWVYKTYADLRYKGYYFDSGIPGQLKGRGDYICFKDFPEDARARIHWFEVRK